MAKMANATKTVISIIVGLLITGGTIAGWATVGTVKAQVDKTQDDRILRSETDIDNVKTDVNGIKLKAAEELATKKAIFDTLHRMETAQTVMTNDVGAMKIDVATTKIQVENLEKAD